MRKTRNGFLPFRTYRRAWVNTANDANFTIVSTFC